MRKYKSHFMEEWENAESTQRRGNYFLFVSFYFLQFDFVFVRYVWIIIILFYFPRFCILNRFERRHFWRVISDFWWIQFDYRRIYGKRTFFCPSPCILKYFWKFLKMVPSISVQRTHASTIFPLKYRQNCFGSDYFQSCVEALLLTDEYPVLERLRLEIGRK